MACAAQSPLLAGGEPVGEDIELEVLDTAQEQCRGENVGGHTRVGRPRADTKAGALGDQIVAPPSYAADGHQGVSDTALVDGKAAGRTDELAEE